jgi:hypothetical protein
MSCDRTHRRTTTDSKHEFMEKKMLQNNVKVTWKAIFAIVLVMATLIAMSTAVSAGFVEFILGEDFVIMATSSTTHTHTSDGGVRIYTWQCPHGGYVYTSTTHCITCGALLGASSASVPCPSGLCTRP